MAACQHAAQIWSDYDEAAAKQAEVEVEDDVGARKPEYIDVIVSDVRTKNGFSFSVQILNTEGNIISSHPPLSYLTLALQGSHR
jgi:hypothetical protein